MRCEVKSLLAYQGDLGISVRGHNIDPNNHAVNLIDRTTRRRDPYWEKNTFFETKHDTSGNASRRDNGGGGLGKSCDFLT